jgi:hypothetical protein
MGAQNLFQNGRGDGVVILVLAGLSLVATLARQYHPLILTGLAALGLLLYSFVTFQRALSELQTTLDTDLAGNPFRGLADLAVQAVQLQWGWILLMIGAVLLIVAGLAGKPMRAR